MSKSDKIAELENRVAELEQARQQEQRVIAALADHGFSRRQMIGLLGAGAVTFVGTASAAPQTQNEPWHGDFAILLGPDPNNDPEEEPTGKRRLMYFGEDTSTIYTTVWDDDTWTQFGTVGGGGGGSAIEYQNDGTSLTTDVTLIDAVDGITATEPTADEIQLDITVADFAGAFLQDDGGGDLEVTGDTDALDGSAGTDGQVWTSTGSAAQWEASPNTPSWTEDPNSPWSGSGASTHTITLSNTYDKVLALIDTEESSGDPDLQANGDTGTNYDYISSGATTTTGADGIARVLGRRTQGFICDGRFSGDTIWHVHIFQSTLDTGDAVIGRNTSVSSPLDSLTVTRSTNFDWQARVYGVDL